MAAPGDTTAKLQHWLDLMRAGDDRARTELCSHACERLRKLARRMLRGYPLVRRWEQTDDVLQNAMLRLYRALAEVTPDSLRHFYSLAALQIRRELLDLAKHHARRDADEPPAAEPADGNEPSSLVEWSEFHRLVETLPAEEREVFDLLWYEELSQAEAAHVLGVSVRTVIRRWQAARIRLQQGLR
jgi:RNA polymerase sigma-70 factor (ECF subfamily)